MFQSSRRRSPYAVAIAGLALMAAASPSARAEPAVPHDRCDYMNHESEAYKYCLAEVAEAKLRADATPPASTTPGGETQPPRRPRS